MTDLISPKTKKVTQSDVAKAVGVSVMTVSKALRAHPDISTATRENILRLARKLGYRKDWFAHRLRGAGHRASPTLADVAKAAGVGASTAGRALRGAKGVDPETAMRIHAAAEAMAYRVEPNARYLGQLSRTEGKGVFHATLGLLVGHKDRDPVPHIPHYRLMISAARARAAEQGYGLDVFWVYHPVMSSKGLARVLRARNIPGLLLLSLGPHEVQQEWMDFACVHIGADPGRSLFSFTAADSFTAMEKACSNLAERGCRRIAFAVPRGRDANSGGRIRAAWLQWHHQSRQRPLTFPPIESQRASWMVRKHPDAIIGWEVVASGLWEWLKDFHRKSKIPMPLVADLHLLPDEKRPRGLCGHVWPYASMGKAAVDMIIGQIHRNEIGDPKILKGTLVEGDWVG